VKPWLLLVGLSIACAPAMRSSATESVVAERLYFGRNSADTLAVTDSAWAVFVTDVVSPRLPDGFTFWKAEGQWRGADGRPSREPSFVLEVVHPQQAAVDSVIVAIIAEYKRRFNQDAVLRVITVGRASF
jgi:hypothetical protein